MNVDPKSAPDLDTILAWMDREGRNASTALIALNLAWRFIALELRELVRPAIARSLHPTGDYQSGREILDWSPIGREPRR